MAFTLSAAFVSGVTTQTSTDIVSGGKYALQTLTAVGTNTVTVNAAAPAEVVAALDVRFEIGGGV